jgi:hypothetical protein
MRTFIIFCCLLFAKDVYCQAFTTDIGAKVGLNISTMSINDKPYGQKIGLVAGIFSIINVSDVIAIQPELSFSMKGTAFKATSDYVFSYNYIEIPIFLKFTVFDSRVLNFDASASNILFEQSRTKIYVLLGPSVGFNVASNLTTNIEKINLNQQVQPIEVAASVGLGMMRDIGEGKLITEMRLSASFSNNLNTLPSQFLNSTALLQSKNIVFSTSIGYALPIEKIFRNFK